MEFFKSISCIHPLNLLLQLLSSWGLDGHISMTAQARELIEKNGAIQKA
jgi:hypothetical protein